MQLGKHVANLLRVVSFHLWSTVQHINWWSLPTKSHFLLLRVNLGKSVTKLAKITEASYFKEKRHSSKTNKNGNQCISKGLVTILDRF